MNEGNNFQLISFESEIDAEGNLSLPRDLLISLRKKGIIKIKVDIKNIYNLNEKTEGISKTVFNKICEVQSLPGSVVYGFLNTKGNLKDKHFADRFDYEKR